MTTELKKRHRVFVDEYKANGGNGTEAARVAGFGGGNPALAVRASELLKRDDVQAALTEADPPGSPARIAGRDERRVFYTNVMRGVDDRGRKIKIPIRERLEASKILGRMEGDFIDRKEVDVRAAVMVVLPDNGRGDSALTAAAADVVDAET